MTKYYEEQQRIEKSRQQKEDAPIAISGEQFTESDKLQYYCNYCQCNLIKMSEEEWYCNRCSISQFPTQEEVRSKSRISTPLGLNLEPCLSYLPDANPTPKKVEPQGAFKTLQDRGLKITNYSERDGAGRVIKRIRWS